MLRDLAASINCATVLKGEFDLPTMTNGSVASVATGAKSVAGSNGSFL